MQLLRFDLAVLRGDLFGGLTAAVVALPLALAFGVASGVGPIAGLYGAIAVGFFAAIFGGTPAQVSGPTGPMTIVMAAVVSLYANDLATAFLIVMAGGLIQIVFGLLRVGSFISYTPYSVISGFMSGVGVIIILLQVPVFLGAPSAPATPLSVLQSLPAVMADTDAASLVTAVASLLAMLFWPKSLRIFVPPPLAALLVGAGMSLLIPGGVQVIGTVPTGFPQFHWPSVPPEQIAGVIQPAFILALLGSIDSLLTSLIADSVTRSHHDSNRELVGQGIGNLAAGLLGALPGAGATMRTLVNVRAGGRTRVSGVVHSLILLILALGLGPLVEDIPLAALAGILVKVGWDIIDWNYLKRLHRAPREKVLVMLITLGLTVFVDLITAVAVGLIIAGFVTARWMEAEELKGVTAVALTDDSAVAEKDREALRELREDVLVISLRGRFSYASARQLTRRAGIAAGGAYRVVILDFSEAAYIDTSAGMAVREIIESLNSQDVACITAGLGGQAMKDLDDLGVLELVPEERCCETKAQAIVRAIEYIEKNSSAIRNRSANS
ncbi:MAG: SulP family inorganic anion transporter [Gammaproteobacteria bacterium]|jgi:SulP family sulfate permease|nr:SulP family inorganic anion transporter [Gammaproteobacteria bacterium]